MFFAKFRGTCGDYDTTLLFQELIVQSKISVSKQAGVVHPDEDKSSEKGPQPCKGGPRGSDVWENQEIGK